MNDGGAGSIWMPMWYMGRFTDYMADLKGKIAIRPMPRWTKGGNRSAGMGGTGTVVTKQSKAIDLAKQFTVYAKGSKEGNIAIWKLLGFDPIRWDVWSDPAMNEPNKFTQFFQTKGVLAVSIQFIQDSGYLKEKTNKPFLYSHLVSLLFLFFFLTLPWDTSTQSLILSNLAIIHSTPTLHIFSS